MIHLYVLCQRLETVSTFKSKFLTYALGSITFLFLIPHENFSSHYLTVQVEQAIFERHLVFLEPEENKIQKRYNIVEVTASINAHAWPGSGMRRKVDSIGGDFSSVLLVFINYSIKLCIAFRK